MNTKNNSIVLWRIIFGYLIMIFHFDNKYAISQHFGLALGWYIGVEFFFIVSGYLLYANLDVLAEKYRSGPAYLWYRYRKIYPCYLVSFILCFVFLFLTEKDFSIFNMIKALSNHFFEVFALQGIGLDERWTYINNTGWFISILFICDFLIYHCLVKWRDTFVNFVAPIIIIVSFSFLYRNMHGIGGAVQTTGFYENWALMRGLADMCLGILAVRFNSVLAGVKNRKALKTAGILGFLFVIGCSMKYGNSTSDFLYALILTASVAIGFLPSDSRIYEKKWILSWSGLTLYLYLLHDVFRTSIFPAYLGIPAEIPLRFAYLLLYLIVVTGFSIALRLAHDRLRGKLLQQKESRIHAGSGVS